MKASLGTLCNVRIGRTPRRDNPSYWGGSTPWITIRELTGGVIFESKEKISDLAVREVMPSLIPAGTLLYSFKLSIGRMGVAGIPLYTNEAIASLEIKSPNLLDRDYLRFALMRTSAEVGANHAVLGKVLNKAKVEAIEIDVPSLQEQLKKVDTLSRAESIVRQRQEAEKQSQKLVASIFLEMFGDPLKNTMGWMVQTLSALGKITTGNTPPTCHEEYYGGGNLWVRPAELGSMFPITHTERTLTDAGLIVARTVRSGAVLVGCIGTIGKVGYASEMVSFNQQINAVEFDQSKVDDNYGYVCLLLMGSYLAEKGSQMVVPILNKGNFQKIHIPCPPLEKQRAFADHFRSLLSVMTLQAQATTKAQELFDALLAQAFSSAD